MSFNQLIAKSESIKAVDNISFDILAGEIVGFLGPNGAGKTTTIKMIAGLINPDKGAIEYNIKNPTIGVVLEGARNIYWRLTVWENLIYYGGLRNMPGKQVVERSKLLLDEFGLSDKTHKPVQTLSRGMQQKLAIIIAILHDPDLILLDEPTLGLDVMSTRAIKQRIKELAHQQNKAVLITTHQMDLAQHICDRIVVFSKGKIVATDTPAGLRKFLDCTEVEMSLTSKEWHAIEHLFANLSPEVEELDSANLEITLTLQSREQIFEITTALQQNGIVPYRFTMGDPNLEDIFVNIIGS